MPNGMFPKFEFWKSPKKSGAYISPTSELYPETLERIFSAHRIAPGGVTLAAGSDGPLLCGYFAKSSCIIAADVDPLTYWYHRMMIALLRCSGTHQDFIKNQQLICGEMRFPANFHSFFNESEIEQLRDENGLLGEEFLYCCTANLEASCTFAKNPSHLYGGSGNYQRYPKAFNFLKKLADRDGIIPVKADLTSPIETSWLIHLIQSLGQPLRVLNISNIWWEQFSGNAISLARSLEYFRFIASPDALLVATTRALSARKSSEQIHLRNIAFPLRTHSGSSIVANLSRTDVMAQLRFDPTLARENTHDPHQKCGVWRYPDDSSLSCPSDRGRTRRRRSFSDGLPSSDSLGRYFSWKRPLINNGR